MPARTKENIKAFVDHLESWDSPHKEKALSFVKGDPEKVFEVLHSMRRWYSGQTMARALLASHPVLKTTMKLEPSDALGLYRGFKVPRDSDLAKLKAGDKITIPVTRNHGFSSYHIGDDPEQVLRRRAGPGGAHREDARRQGRDPGPGSAVSHRGLVQRALRTVDRKIVSSRGRGIPGACSFDPRRGGSCEEPVDLRTYKRIGVISMTIKCVAGDIWSYAATHSIVVGTNVGWDENADPPMRNNMGAGLAAQARDRYPRLSWWYGLTCCRWALEQQHNHSWMPPQLYVDPVSRERVVLVGVKPLVWAAPHRSWDQPASTPLIEAGLTFLRNEMKGPVAVPLIGSGNGQVDRHKILALIQSCLSVDKNPGRFLVVDPHWKSA